MRKSLLGLLVVLCALIMVSAASADQMAFAMSGFGFNTTGTFYGPPSGPGQWLVTAANGQFNGIAITGVCPLGNCASAFYYDNVYFWPAPNVDNGGIVVTLQNGDWLNICYDSPNCALPGAYAALLWDPNTGITTFNADTVSFQQPIPEPGTLLIMGTGVLGLARTLRRRFL